MAGFFIGGEGGIRTLGTGNRTPDFESGTLDHSATSPIAATHSSKTGIVALRDSIHAAHVRLQGRRYNNRTVGLLIVFQYCYQGSAYRQPRAI